MGTSYQNKQRSLATGIAIGTGISLLTALGLAAGAASLVLAEKISEGSMVFAALGILFISGLIGSIVAAKLIGRMPAIVCGIVILVYFLILLGTNILFFDGAMAGIGSGLLAMIPAYGAACLISLQKGRKKVTRKKVRSR